MATSIKKNGNGALSFSQLQKLYGLKTPEQIKLRMIWNHLQMLTKQVFADSDENKETRKRYDSRFRACEAEEEKLLMKTR